MESMQAAPASPRLLHLRAMLAIDLSFEVDAG